MCVSNEHYKHALPLHGHSSNTCTLCKRTHTHTSHKNTVLFIDGSVAVSFTMFSVLLWQFECLVHSSDARECKIMAKSQRDFRMLMIELGCSLMLTHHASELIIFFCCRVEFIYLFSFSSSPFDRPCAPLCAHSHNLHNDFIHELSLTMCVMK